MTLEERHPAAGRLHQATPGAVIGREQCEVLLTDPGVSRQHARFCEIDGHLALEDLGSKNGTYVNDERITGSVAIRPGDTLRLGNTVLIVKGTAAT